MNLSNNAWESELTSLLVEFARNFDKTDESYKVKDIEDIIRFVEERVVLVSLGKPLNKKKDSIKELGERKWKVK